MTAPAVVLELHLVLGVHRVLFAVDISGVEVGGREKGRKPVQGRLELLCLDVEEIVGVVAGRVGVAAAAMGLDELPVFIDVGVGFGAEEQHVLEKMSEAGTVGRLIEATSKHRQRRGRFVRVGIRNQQHTQRVVEVDETIVSIVVWTLGNDQILVIGCRVGG